MKEQVVQYADVVAPMGVVVSVLPVRCVAQAVFPRRHFVLQQGCSNGVCGFVQVEQEAIFALIERTDKVLIVVKVRRLLVRRQDGVPKDA